MIKSFTTFFFIFFLLVSQIEAQTGTSIQITDGTGSCTLLYDGVVNGKYSYKAFGCRATIHPDYGYRVFWNTVGWSINTIAIGSGYNVPSYSSNVETALYPPDFSVGNWAVVSGPAAGGNLTVFSGTGTTNIPCLGTPSFTAGATSLCAGATVTYTATATNVQTTVYSIVGGTGATINASTGVVSNVTSNFTVRATLTGLCGASKTVDRAVAYSCENNGLNFDGSNDNIIVSAFPMTAYTIEAWVKPTDTNNRNIFNGGDNNFGYYSHSLRIVGGKFIHYTYDGNLNSVTGTTPIVAGQWYHVAITAENNGQMKLFVNGNEEGTSLPVGTLWTGLDRFYIGNDRGAFLGNFFGTIDEFRVWNIARTAAQIQTMINNPLVGNETGLTSYMKFNQGMANGNNTAISLATATTGSSGSLSGFALTGTSSNFVTGTIFNAALPVELLSFNGKNKGVRNLLFWQTASEVNNSHFDIERSTDGTTFQKIGQVKGNNKPSNYEFVDHQPFVTTYYRLRQSDFDSTETLSNIVYVTQKGKGKALAIYPNPVTNVLSLGNMEDTTREDWEEDNFQIFNLFGQQVLVGKTRQQIDVSVLQQGTYIFKIGSEQVKFVKQ
jgi:hypothetical protein